MARVDLQVVARLQMIASQRTDATRSRARQPSAEPHTLDLSG